MARVRVCGVRTQWAGRLAGRTGWRLSEAEPIQLPDHEHVTRTDEFEYLSQARAVVFRARGVIREQVPEDPDFLIPISVADVIQAVDGPLTVTACSDDDQDCEQPEQGDYRPLPEESPDPGRRRPAGPARGDGPRGTCA